MNIFDKVSVVAVMAVSLALGLFGPTVALATVGGPTCFVPGDYSTIQAAIDDAGCTTINVAAGTYPEHVNIYRSLVLNGANAGTAGNGVRLPESVITGVVSGALQITADNVTVDGFKIMSPSNILGSGIHLSAVNSGYFITNNLITGNQIGIYLNSNGASIISYNLFDGSNEPGAAGGAGIYSEFTDQVTIDHNEFKNHNLNNPAIFGATILDAHKNLTFSNNYIHDNPCGCSAIFALALKDAVFTGNDISADEKDLYFGGGNHGVAITKNILHSTVGVYVQALVPFGLNTDIVVNRNSLTEHFDFGIQNDNGQIADVDGTCNWWGAVDGPGLVGTGSGDNVSAGVTFSPWLTSSDLDGSCLGFATRNECKAVMKEDHDAFRAQQKADKEAFEATNPTKEERRAFKDAQKVVRQAFDAQNKSDKEECKELPKELGDVIPPDVLPV